MDKVLSYGQIQSFVSEIRSLRKGFVSNLFWDSNKHPYWIAEGNFFFQKGNACVLMVHQKEDFCNLFYIATDMSTVSTAAASLPLETTCVVDVVCRGDGEEVYSQLSYAGFYPYRHLFRMSHAGVLADDSWEMGQDVIFGTSEDVMPLYDVLVKNFDPLSEQLPSVEELNDFVRRKQVLVIKNGKELCGFIIFEVTGMTWYLRYWFTCLAYRNQGVGARLLKSSLFLAKESKRQILWVISDNINAIKRYEHYGFKRELMDDYVLIKKTID